MAATLRSASPLSRGIPVLFVILWSTGFIGAKFGLPHAGPRSFLAVRFILVTLVMTPIALVSGVRWPDRATLVLHIAIVGLLMQFGYMGGVFMGIANGVPAGISALIVSLQPVLTAALAGTVLGERLSRRQWVGLGLGLAGVVLVVVNPALLEGGRLAGAGFTAGAMLAITIGTLYQKRFCTEVDLRATIVIQNAASALAMVPLALLIAPARIDWSMSFVLTLLWLALGLSIGAGMLLFYLLRRGGAAPVSSLFFLTPAVTALMAFALFGEHLSPMALAGMALSSVGVWAVNAKAGSTP